MTTSTNAVTLADPSLGAISLATLPLIARLRKQHFRTKPAVCVERAKWITHYLKNPAAPDEPAVLQRARAVNAYLANREACFPDDNLLAGTTTAKAIGAPVYPELLGLTIWPELDTLSERATNPQTLSPADAELLNFEIFPYWLDRNVQEVARAKFNNPPCLRLFERIVFYINGKSGCISHCVPGYGDALHRGLSAVAADARQRELAAAAAPAGSAARSAVAFYQAVQVAIAGILRYTQRLSRKAADLAAKEAEPARRQNYEAMAAVCAQVPAGPARNFREAVNALWLCQVAIHAENINMAMSPGRLDQVLYPFYRQDVAQQRLTVEEALNLCCCLWLKLADNTNLAPEQAERLWGGAGSTPAVTLGGVDGDGHDAVNDLTYILLKTTELMALRDPSVNARYHYEQNERRYRDRVAEVIVNTRAIPAFHNDVPAVQTLVNQGLTPEHARDFGIVGCVELASTGRDYVSSSSIMFNLSAPLEMTLFNGRRLVTGDEQLGPQTGEPATFTAFSQFWEAFTTQLRWLIEQAIAMNEKFGAVHQELLPTPLLSLFFAGPLESGRDLVFGGARYNSSGASHVAFADVCDSLNAIEAAVFTDRRLTMAEMVAAIRANFAPPHDRHLPYLRNQAPKFGTAHPIAVKNSRQLIRFLHELYQSHTNYRGGRYRAAYWTMTTHAGQGKLAGALPNGRRAHEVFASGITPASQAAPDLLEVYRSVAGLDAAHYIPGGQALNIKHTPPLNGNRTEYVQRLGDLVEGYFRQGGLQVQFNIQTYETLIDAQQHPEQYPELIVRVSGYSAYFKDLSGPMKDELIARTQYDPQRATAVPLPPTWTPGQPAPAATGRTAAARDFGFVQRYLLKRRLTALAACLETDALDPLLELLLGGMSLALLVDGDYRRNIRDFTARYSFQSRDGKIAAGAAFGRNLLGFPTLTVYPHAIARANVTVTFRDGRALKDFLFAANPDVFGAMIENTVVFEGNLNYLLKFAYLAKRLQLQFLPAFRP